MSAMEKQLPPHIGISTDELLSQLDCRKHTLDQTRGGIGETLAAKEERRMTGCDYVSQKEEETLVHRSPVASGSGQEPPWSLFGSVEDDRVRLSEHKGELIALSFDQYRDLSSRIQGQVIRPFMLTFR